MLDIKAITTAFDYASTQCEENGLILPLTTWAKLYGRELLEEIEELTKQREEIKAERDEFRSLFDLQETRMEEATRIWRAAHPGNDNVLPDLGRLLDWLIAAKRGKAVVVANEIIVALNKACKDSEMAKEAAEAEVQRYRDALTKIKIMAHDELISGDALRAMTGIFALQPGITDEAAIRIADEENRLTEYERRCVRAALSPQQTASEGK